MAGLGERLSVYRQNRNFTQEELAARLGVTPQAVSKWERGQSYPDVTILPDICRLLGVSADLLLETECGNFSENNDPVVNEEILRELRGCEEPLAIVFGMGLVEEVAKKPYVKHIADKRRELAKNGVLMPVVCIKDACQLEENQWMILSYHRVLFSERLEEMPEDISLHMAELLGKTVTENYGRILNRELVRAIAENLRITYPALIEGVIPEKISYGLLQNVMTGLLERGCNPVFYMVKIIEAMEDLLREKPDASGAELTKAAAAAVEHEDNFWIVTAKG